jgi:hypothetical protein
LCIAKIPVFSYILNLILLLRRVDSLVECVCYNANLSKTIDHGP